ncbi:hypothetical protein GGS24DRAFT_477762 [Hypoxylon argillaceum]|nr:hypothetical protein GGS24DRAFT_477762 [Hypoxylon argillaceum]
MARYGNRHDVNQKKNRIALRHDLHSAFDSQLFAIVPKNNYYVIHQFHDNDICAREFASTYHNRIVVSEGVVREFLFARLARALLMLVQPFMTQSPLKRYVVRLRAVEGSNVGSGQYHTQSEWLSPQQLSEQYSGGGTKSASPTKRKRDGENPPGNQQAYEADNDSSDYKSNSDDSDTEGEWYKTNVAVLLEGDRGRSRKRRRGDTSSDSDTEEEWYKKNVAVLLEGDRGRSRKRRCDEPGVDDGETTRHNNSQPPFLTTSISSIQSCAGLEQDTSSDLGVEVQRQKLSNGNTNQNDAQLGTLL